MLIRYGEKAKTVLFQHVMISTTNDLMNTSVTTYTNEINKLKIVTTIISKWLQNEEKKPKKTLLCSEDFYFLKETLLHLKLRQPSNTQTMLLDSMISCTLQKKNGI